MQIELHGAALTNHNLKEFGGGSMQADLDDDDLDDEGESLSVYDAALI